MLFLLPLLATKRQEVLGEIDKLPLGEKTDLFLKDILAGKYLHREYVIMVSAKACMEMQEIKDEIKLEG